VPLRSQLEHTDLLIGRVTAADPASGRLTVARIDGAEVVLDYDRLVVALGSVSRTLPIPGLAEHAMGLKSLADATALRNRVLSCLDIAESLEDPEERREYLGFVGVGAGYAGVEGLAELQDFASRVIDLYPRCRTQGMRWVLVEAQGRIMGEVSKGLSRFARRELEGRGIEVLTETTLSEVTARSARLSNGEEIAARTVLWTAGVKPAPAVARLGLPLDAGGRIVVDGKMRVEGHEGVWAIGDCAAVPDPAHRGKPCPPTAQHALRQGRRVARNVAATLGNGRERPFRWRSLGVVAELGHNQAVAITVGIRWRGLPAWLIARTYHLLLMPGVGRKLRLLVDWNVALLFGRDASDPGRLGSRTPLEHSEEPGAAYPDG
jgi:NADH dehydrogenase